MNNMITLPQLLHIVNQLLVANYLTQANVHRLHKPEIINPVQKESIFAEYPITFM